MDVAIDPLLVSICPVFVSIVDVGQGHRPCTEQGDNPLVVSRLTSAVVVDLPPEYASTGPTPTATCPPYYPTRAVPIVVVLPPKYIGAPGSSLMLICCIIDSAERHGF